MAVNIPTTLDTHCSHSLENIPHHPSFKDLRYMSAMTHTVGPTSVLMKALKRIITHMLSQSIQGELDP